MLVLTRKIGQKLIIADNIEVIILETKGEAVKIGIKAPQNITIYREEIYEEIKKANEQSSKNVLITDLDVAFNLAGTKKQSDDLLTKIRTVTNSAEIKKSSKK